MKKFSLFILSLGMALNSFALIPESEYPIKIDETHFPDVHFREAFVKEKYDTNSDGYLSYEEANILGFSYDEDSYSYTQQEMAKEYSIHKAKNVDGLEYFHGMAWFRGEISSVMYFDLEKIASNNPDVTRFAIVHGEMYSNLIFLNYPEEWSDSEEDEILSHLRLHREVLLENDRRYDLSADIAHGMDLTRISDLKGGHIEGNYMVFEDEVVTYKYYFGKYGIYNEEPVDTYCEVKIKNKIKPDRVNMLAPTDFTDEGYTISWTPSVENIDGYMFYHSICDENNESIRTDTYELPATQTSFVITDRGRGNDRCMVRAMKNGELSEMTQYTVGKDEPQVGVHSISYSDLTDTSYTINWEPPTRYTDEVDKYLISRWVVSILPENQNEITVAFNSYEVTGEETSLEITNRVLEVDGKPFGSGYEEIAVFPVIFNCREGYCDRRIRIAANEGVFGAIALPPTEFTQDSYMANWQAQNPEYSEIQYWNVYRHYYEYNPNAMYMIPYKTEICQIDKDVRNCLMSNWTRSDIEGYQIEGISMGGRSSGLSEPEYIRPDSWIHVENIETENAPKEYYTLQGLRVEGTPSDPGIYIMRQGSKVVKIIVK